MIHMTYIHGLGVLHKWPDGRLLLVNDGRRFDPTYIPTDEDHKHAVQTTVQYQLMRNPSPIQIHRTQTPPDR